MLTLLNFFHYNGEHCFIFTMDITFLYTAIPNNEGLLVLEYFLKRREIQDPPTDTLLRMAELHQDKTTRSEAIKPSFSNTVEAIMFENVAEMIKHLIQPLKLSLQSKRKTKSGI